MQGWHRLLLQGVPRRQGMRRYLHPHQQHLPFPIRLRVQRMKRFVFKRVTVEHFGVLAETRQQAEAKIKAAPGLCSLGNAHVKWSCESQRAEPTPVKTPS